MFDEIYFGQFYFAETKGKTTTMPVVLHDTPLERSLFRDKKAELQMHHVYSFALPPGRCNEGG